VPSPIQKTAIPHDARLLMLGILVLDTIVSAVESAAGQAPLLASAVVVFAVEPLQRVRKEQLLKNWMSMVQLLESPCAHLDPPTAVEWTLEGHQVLSLCHTDLSAAARA